MTRNMAMVLKLTTTGKNTKANGKQTIKTESASSHTQMGGNTPENT